ncbi:hypothetical protein [Methylorubrum populi]
MLYSEEVLDRRTGELVKVNQGEWITVTELAGLYGVGPRKARSVLRKMEFLGIEGTLAPTRWGAITGPGASPTRRRCTRGAPPTPPSGAGLLTRLVSRLQHLFDTRASGTTSSILGNPTFDLVDTAYKASGGVFRAARQGGYSQPEARSAARILPFSNAIGMVPLLNVMISNLPEHKRRSSY